MKPATEFPPHDLNHSLVMYHRHENRRCGLPNWRWMLAVLALCRLTLAADTAAGETDESVGFFEKHIRPALVEHCLECHSTDGEASGGLLLDSRQGWADGGDLGPAIVPGDASASLLIRAIEYDEPDLEMPPDGKLDQAIIDSFRKWVSTGAVDPRIKKPNSQPDSRPSGLTPQRALEHWSYRPIRDSPLRFNGRTESVIDQMIQSRLEQAGLTAAPPASRRSLVRRLSMDLLGMPPSETTINRFLADTSPLAYERLVDRLLASPRFGETFARRWMDVARYAESITLRGFVLPEAWRYRDYLIDSFADDRPFNQMIRDQIAGDLLPTDDLRETQQRAIATAFLAMGNSNLEDQDKTKLEFDHLDEQLETIGRAFLAQTIGCARCHDHKFDPITTQDYYALAGIFRSTTPLQHANLSKWIEKPLPLDAEQQRHFQEIENELAAVAADLKAVDRKLAVDGKSNRMPIDLESLPGIVVDDTEAVYVGSWTESSFVRPYVGSGYHHDETQGQGSKTATFEPKDIKPGRYEVRMSYTAHDNRATNTKVTVFSANESKTVHVNQRRTPPEDSAWISLGNYPFEKDGQAFVIVSNEDADGCVIVDAIQFLPYTDDRQPQVTVTPPPEAVKQAEVEKADLQRRQKQLQTLLDRRPKFMTIAESEPRAQTEIRIRGNVHQLGEPVPRGFLSSIGPVDRYVEALDASSSGRVQLANWIADPDNPLTARVYANRVWSWLIGEGLVATENNFGTTGESPSHPELLDFLSGELIRNDWSTKHLVRMIVTSEVYRRAVVEDSERIVIDPGNRLCASANLKRIPVEAMRDAMLMISGELDLQMRGSLIRPGTGADYDYRHQSSRRSIYHPVFRNSLPPLFETFDFADTSVSVGQRSRSTVAPQSLAMMNHPWVVQRAQIAAGRLANLARTDADILIDRLYRRCFGRHPDETEMRFCLDFLGKATEAETEQRLADLIQSLFGSIDFRYLD